MVLSDPGKSLRVSSLCQYCDFSVSPYESGDFPDSHMDSGDGLPDPIDRAGVLLDLLLGWSANYSRDRCLSNAQLL